LGLLNGAVQIAALIEAGVIEAGIVVGTENSRPLLTTTIEMLNRNTTLTRQSVKPAFASLTIGSGSCAWLLAHERLAPRGSKLLTAVADANTAFHDLCLSHEDTAGAEMVPLMDTDSERLMAEGIATGVAAFEKLLTESAWSRHCIDRSVCHQVGARHREAMLQAFGLSTDRDSITYDELGNTGSVALPLTLAAAARRKELLPRARVALLGIGSGINSVMLAMEWDATQLHD
jgi:3-oxoacyl-[acyl-carrier-protein] synthase-3